MYSGAAEIVKVPMRAYELTGREKCPIYFVIVKRDEGERERNGREDGPIRQGSG
jgi:hypothetical protein